MNHKYAFKAASNFTIFLLAMLCILFSCSKKITFSTSAVVPAAEGSVKIKKDKNENYAVDLTVHHLSAPDRLMEAKNLYIVWANTKENGVRNMGQLKSGHGIFSKALTGSLKTVTTFEPVNFFITAEKDASIRYPEGQVVLTTK
jgi:hypothetical protein